MVLKRITDRSDAMYRQAMELYRSSFPYHEQRKAASQEKILGDKEYHFALIYDGTVFIGLILYWEAERFCYIEHFCILPEMRNKRYGQRALELLKKEEKTLILEIDPPVDEISERRKGFYERCGFRENPFVHIHPPYHKEFQGHRLVVMTSPEQISPEEFENFSWYLRNRVMENVF